MEQWCNWSKLPNLKIDHCFIKKYVADIFVIVQLLKLRIVYEDHKLILSQENKKNEPQEGVRKKDLANKFLTQILNEQVDFLDFTGEASRGKHKKSSPFFSSFFVHALMQPSLVLKGLKEELKTPGSEEVSQQKIIA